MFLTLFTISVGWVIHTRTFQSPYIRNEYQDLDDKQNRTRPIIVPNTDQPLLLHEVQFMYSKSYSVIFITYQGISSISDYYYSKISVKF